ncbi:hypothetical protein GF325_07470 [Candidatus Bathyarchaeota archaeon]|nr:hypothetical protein [Candidatus Bathyarchaeota archaeon]
MAIEYIKEIGLVAFSCYVTLLFIGAALLYRKGRKEMARVKKAGVYNYLLMAFILFLGLAYVVRMYFMFFLAGSDAEFINQMTATERTGLALPGYAADGRLHILQLSWQVHMCLIFVGIGFLTLSTEYLFFKKTKYMLAIFSFAITPFMIILPYEIAHRIYMIFYFSPIAWALVYIIVARNSTGSVRVNALMLLLGMVIFIIGTVMNSSTFREFLFETVSYHVAEDSVFISVLLSPIVLIIGCVITISALFSKFKPLHGGEEVTRQEVVTVE